MAVEQVSAPLAFLARSKAKGPTSQSTQIWRSQMEDVHSMAELGVTARLDNAPSHVTEGERARLR